LVLPTRIFVTATLSDQAKKILDGFEIFENSAEDSILAQCQVLMAWPTRVRRELLEKMPDLKMVQALSAGVDGLDFAYLPPGTQVYSNAGAYTESVAEHAWGLLLGASKGLAARQQKVIPRKLSGKTLLVVGCGSIGSEIARLSKSVGMKTIGVSRSFKVPELFDERYPLGELWNVFGAADEIAVALPLTRQTIGLIDHDMLMHSKENVTIVNVGRGDTVSEQGLITWLRERPESCYTTDVFWTRNGKETFDTEAWSLPNFSGTLHTSGVPLGENLDHPLLEAAKNVRSFLKTGEASNKVNPAEYVPPPHK
jgi:phosphoglycerate dehydrogenase-like enzyme